MKRKQLARQSPRVLERSVGYRLLLDYGLAISCSPSQGRRVIIDQQ